VKTLSRLLAGTLVAATLASATSAAEGPVVSEGAHYRLVSTGTQAEADEWVRMLEAAWPQYAEFFGKAPPAAKDAKLAVAFFETIGDMQAAIRKAGGAPPKDAGGYYDPGSKTAFAWRQPSAWYTRTLLLHECAHQFHLLSRVAARTDLPAWYVEGVAEHVSHHTWDGERLRLGVVPLLSLEKRAGVALDAAKSSKLDLEALFDNRGEADRSQCMHVVRYLCQAEGGKLRPKFDEVAAKLDRGAKLDAKSCASAFGPTKKLAASIASWLPTVQEPWECVTIEWDARAADALRGHSASVVSLCRRRAATRSVSARMRVHAAGARKGGVLLRFGGSDDFDVGIVTGAGRFYVDRRKSGSWTRLVEGAAPAPEEGAWRVGAVRDGGSVAFVVAGETVASIEAPPGSMGLALDASTVDFTEIAAE
jgi:hypothetical protein